MDRFAYLDLDPPSDAGLEPIVAEQFRHDAASFHQSGMALLARGYLPQAAEMLERALGFREHDFPLWIDAIDTLVRAGQLERAETYSQEALGNYRQSAPLFPAHALVLARRERYGEALGHCQVSLEHARRDTHWYAHAIRGEILLRKGKANRAEAVECFDRAMDGLPNPWRAALIAAFAFQDAGLPVFAAGAASEVAHWNPRACIGWLLLAQSFEALRLYAQAEFYYACVLDLEPHHRIAAPGKQTAKAHQFGLTRVFRRENLNGRWRTAFEQALNRTG